ncbi:MAG: Asp-tRNA(Asn)/Glu-tRNA(Gln) amidotransferase subunit GatB [Patescibacteria group bacterium]
MKLETVIGLEIHLQLATQSKMFCACANVGPEAQPNSAVCPICLGHPGTLPVPNREALALALRFARALDFTVPEVTVFDRKHYAYPDLPKGYQISQFDKPIGQRGHFLVDLDGKPHRVQFERVHIEEDSAKNIRAADGNVLVDCNRAGTPLIELVTLPLIDTPAEAKLVLQELQRIARYLGISQADMESGHLRCDANISLRPAPEDLAAAPIQPNAQGLFPKTEIKNLNSFRHVERALAYEITRQVDLWNAGTPPTVTSTRGWDDRRSVTVEQRVKEDSADYRYFAEPDIPPIALTPSFLASVDKYVVELPRPKRQRFMAQYNVSVSDAFLLTDDLAIADWFEHVVSELQRWVTTRLGGEERPEEEWTKANAKLMQQAATWVTTRLLGTLAEQGKTFSQAGVSAENFAEFLTLLAERKLNTTSAQVVLKRMVESGENPQEIMRAGDLTQVTDAASIVQLVDRTLQENADIVAEVKAGKVAKAQFLVGQVMKLSKGTADPTLVRELLAGKLDISL